LKFAFPIGLNIVADAVLAYYMTYLAVSIPTDSWPNSNMCKSWYRHPDGRYDLKPGTAECAQALLATKIMEGLCAGFGAIVAYVFILGLRREGVLMFGQVESSCFVGIEGCGDV